MRKFVFISMLASAKVGAMAQSMTYNHYANGELVHHTGIVIIGHRLCPGPVDDL